MADNVTLNSGSGGATAASDEIGGVQYQRVKVTWGGDGTANDTSASNPLPVTGTQTEDAAHNSGDQGMFILGVRNESFTTLVSDDGDYAPLTTDAQGALYITNGNVVSSNNSSTSTLVADATFTGTGEDVSRFATVAISLDSDQDSATDGISIEFSSDNSNWDHQQNFTYTASAGREILVPVQAQYFRIVYTNGGTGQGHFRLQTIFHANPTSPEVDRLSDDESPEKDAITVKSAIIAQQAGTGDFIAVESSGSGRLKVDSVLGEAIPAGDNNIGNVDIVSFPDNEPFNVSQVGGNSVDTNTGNASTGTQRVVLASDQPVVSVDDNSGSLTVDGTVTANAGTGTFSIQEAAALDVSAATVTVSGTVTANLSSTDNTVLDNIDTNTSASGNHYRNIDANAEDAIKGSAGTLHWVHVMNMTASVAYLHLYDATTGNVTPGSTTPDFTFPIPTQGDTNGAGFNLPLGPNGQAFANAITLVCTTTTDGSAGDPGTNGVFVNAGYS